MVEFLRANENAPERAFSFARGTGLEPATFRVTGGCSNQLSYPRNIRQALRYPSKIYVNCRVLAEGLAPSTLAL